MTRRAVLALLVAALLFAAPVASYAVDPYELNVVLSLTGSGSFLGKSEATTLGLLETYENKRGGINGRPIKFVIADDQSNPQVAVQLTNAILQKSVPVMLGSSLVASCNAMAALMKNGPVQFCFSSGFHPAAGGYGFAYGVSTDDLIAVTVRYFRERGWKKVAIISSTDATGQDGERGFDAALAAPENKEMSVLAREHFANTDLTVSAQMARIKASGAQAIITWTSGTPMGTLLHGIKDAGLSLPVTASASNLSYEEFKQFADLLPATLDIAAMPSVALPSLPRGRVHDAVATYVGTLTAAGLHPDNTHGIAWDPATIVISALRKLGTNATPAQIRDYIAGLHGWAGIIGEYDFRDGSQRGVGQNYGIVVRWDPAKDTWVGVSKFGGNL